MVVVPSGFLQQLDNSSPVEDAWDYTQDADDDSWFAEADCGPVEADVIPPPSYYGEDAELADQGDEDQPIVDEYIVGAPDALQPQLTFDWFIQDEDDYSVEDGAQQADNSPPEPEDAWDHFSIDESELVVVPSGYLQGDLDVLSIDDPWEWWLAEDDDYAVIDDFALVDFANTAAIAEDAADHFLTDEDDYVVVDDYTLVENLSPVEDAWDHWTTDDDDYAVSENYSSDSVTQYYGEDAEQLAQEDDDQVIVFEFASVDNNPALCLEDAADHWPTEDDDYVVLDDYALVENLGPVEDAWDHFVGDDDEQADVSEFALLSVPVTTVQYYGEDAECADADQDDDEWLVRTADMLGATLAQVFDDAWDYWAADEDESTFSDDYTNGIIVAANDDAWDHFTVDDEALPPSDDYQNTSIIAVEDAWNHWAVDDDEPVPIDEAVQPVLARQVEDAWDHWFAEANEEIVLDEVQSTAVSLLPCPDDPWDHFPTTDDDRYDVVDDYELRTFATLNLVGVSFSGSFALGTLVLLTPRGPYQYDPRFYNGSNAWLGYRTASGGGIW